MSSTQQCVQEIQGEIALYWVGVHTSIALTFAMIIVRRTCLQKSLESRDAGKIRQIGHVYLGTGVVKMILGLLLVTVLVPGCPSDCVCTGIRFGHPVYGFIAMGLALLWLSQGYSCYKKAEEYGHTSAVATSEGGIKMTENTDGIV